MQLSKLIGAVAGIILTIINHLNSDLHIDQIPYLSCLLFASMHLFQNIQLLLAALGLSGALALFLELASFEFFYRELLLCVAVTRLLIQFTALLFMQFNRQKLKLLIRKISTGCLHGLHFLVKIGNVELYLLGLV